MALVDLLVKVDVNVHFRVFEVTLSFSQGNKLISSSVVLVGFLMGKTVEAIILWFRLIYLVVLFTPTLVVGVFINQTEGGLRRFWLHLLLRSLEAAGNFPYHEVLCQSA